MSNNEIWRIVSQNSNYEISDFGSLRRIKPTKSVKRDLPYLLNAVKKSTGYHEYTLWDRNGAKKCYAHRLVAFEFLGPPPGPGYDVEHLDGNRVNNKVCNLRWATRKENNQRKFLHGTHKIGSHAYQAKLTEKDIPSIRTRYANGETYRKIACDFGVSPATIAGAVCGKTWKHV